MPVLGALGWAVSTGLSQPRSEGGLENQHLVASVSPQALKHCTGTSLQVRKSCACPGTHRAPDLQQSLAAGAAPQGAGLQLGSLGISRAAINKLNWMFEAFLTWHQGAPSGFICLLGKQRIWPHAALSHKTALLPLILARPWHT